MFITEISIKKKEVWSSVRKQISVFQVFHIVTDLDLGEKVFDTQEWYEISQCIYVEIIINPKMRTEIKIEMKFKIKANMKIKIKILTWMYDSISVRYIISSLILIFIWFEERSRIRNRIAVAFTESDFKYA